MVQSPVSIIAILILAGIVLGALALLGMILANKQTRLLGLALTGFGVVMLVLVVMGSLLFITQHHEMPDPGAKYIPSLEVQSPDHATFFVNGQEAAYAQETSVYRASEINVSWLVLLILPLFVGLIIGLVVFFRRSNVSPWWLLTGVPIVLFMMLLTKGTESYNKSYSKDVQQRAMLASEVQARLVEERASSRNALSSSSADRAFDQLTEPKIDLSEANTEGEPAEPTAPDAATAVVTSAPDAATAVVTSAPDSTEAVAAEADPPAESSKPAKPKWLTSPPKQSDGVYRTVIESGPYSTVDECRRDQRFKLLTAVNAYLRSNTEHTAHSVVEASYYGVTYSELSQRFLQEEFWQESEGSFSEMQTLHTLVEIDQSDGNWLVHSWRVKRNRGTVSAVFALFGGVLGLLGLTFGLLKIDEATKGFYSKRLFVGVPVAIIVLLSLLAAVA